MYKEFKKEYKYELRQIKLSELCTLKIGGLTDLFFEVKNIEELVYAVKTAGKYDVPFFLIGCGSNIFFSDDGFEGLIIKNSIEKIMETENNLLHISSSVEIKDLTDFFLEYSIEGFEFLAGIPGTIGGAVFMNAGAFGENIGDYLHSAKIMNCDGKILNVNKEYFKFDYRKSILRKSREIVIEVKLKYKTGNKESIKQKVNEIINLRNQKHPPKGTLTAGSFFKNISAENKEKKTAAGLLLDKAGAKGMKVGGAEVSNKHANFIINSGNASANDILTLAEKLKKKVEKMFKIDLEEEVIYVPKKI